MAEVVLDANILVAWLDEGDSQHALATAILDRLEQLGDRIVLLDILLSEDSGFDVVNDFRRIGV
jgi:predicted nucleic acid-binding protein